jgi:sterol desaturase/sphingolipid hydroxylase (fatty acid hydroxylase superfamily)
VSTVKATFKQLDRIDKATLPMFAVTMLWEHAALRRKSRRKLDTGDHTGHDAKPTVESRQPLVPLGYERRDTVANLSMLAGNIAIGFAFSALLGRAPHGLYRRRLHTFGSATKQMALAMVLWDFLYYWDHRWMHEVRLLWANHVTHHSSRRYNLSTALRQPWSPFLTFWVFLPMPLLGIAPKAVAKAGQLNLLYQYWIHTEAIDRLPKPLELVLNTPSHHRVHHGTNTEYLDRNYGGILIVWDKLFGTFEPELQRVRYGLTKNINTYNPLRIAYHELIDIVGDVRRAGSARRRLRAVFGHPGAAV